MFLSNTPLHNLSFENEFFIFGRHLASHPSHFYTPTYTVICTPYTYTYSPNWNSLSHQLTRWLQMVRWINHQMRVSNTMITKFFASGTVILCASTDTSKYFNIRMKTIQFASLLTFTFYKRHCNVHLHSMVCLGYTYVWLAKRFKSCFLVPEAVLIRSLITQYVLWN